MLFAAIGRARPGTQQQRIARRLEWDYPEGHRVVCEYWLETLDPAFVAIFEADHIGQIWAGLAGWDEFFELTVVPTIEAQEGLEMLKQMAAG
jgi:hypothetical protein